jgi:stage V sporulation protein D (sporulation-specific penicillin-binding protein)
MQQSSKASSSLTRIRLWYALLLVFCGLILIRVFYLQVIRHNYYQSAALSGQLKEYEIPAQRGVIEAYNGDQVMPLVLNEVKYTLFADPKFIKDPEKSARAVEKLIGGDRNYYEEQMEADSRYAVLAKKLSKDQKALVDDARKQESDDLAGKQGAVYLWKGIGTREAAYRTYPQGIMAAQVLGFVNDEGEGKYGLEEALNNQLKGTPGLLKAITDARGIPLASNRDNVSVEPKAGERTLLTLDIGMQQRLEEILKTGLDNAKSGSGGALIIEAHSGAVKAMANYPTFNPADFFKVEDASVFTNATVSAPLEVGSVMKPLTVAAALDKGVINKNTTYYDPGFWKIGDAKVTNIEEVGGAATKSISDILRQSLNTGATWLLMQMGGGEINEKARVTWHDYMVNRYQFGHLTGIEQGYEAGGSIPDPVDGFGLNIQYANTAFGQGMTATPLQMAAALSSVVNGGTYYKPRLVEKTNNSVHKPEIVKQGVVSSSAAKETRDLMEYAFSQNYRGYGMSSLRPEYAIGGKTGTAQVPRPEGGYYEDRYNGMFMGFVGGNDAQYVIVVRVNEPKIAGYAGSKAAGPIFSALATMLIDNFGVTPKS